MCPICTLVRAKDLVTLFELGSLASRQGGRCLENDTRELGAGYPWEGGLVLVLAPNLEEVEEVCCRGTNRN